MPSKMPPVPPDNRSRKGPGDKPDVPEDDQPGEAKNPNIEQQGRHGNIRQNVPRQGSRTSDR